VRAKSKIAGKLRQARRLVFLSYVDDCDNRAYQCLRSFEQALNPISEDHLDFPVLLRTSKSACSEGDIIATTLADLWRNVTDFVALLTSEYLTANDPKRTTLPDHGELSQVMKRKADESLAEDHQLTIWLAPVETLQFKLARPGGYNPNRPPWSDLWHVPKKEGGRFSVESGKAVELREEVQKALDVVLHHPLECRDHCHDKGTLT
jgi:hypothetical protein